MVEKWNKIKYLLDEADTGSMDDIYINFLSGVGDGPDGDGTRVVTPFPFFVASGHIVEGARFKQGTDGGHQRLRGRDVPDECGPFYLPKGVKQFEDRCVFTGMNELILDKWINDDAVTKQTGRIGIIMADFPSDLLVDAIIAVNNLPPIADVNGPYVGNEGSEIIFDASASSDPDGDALQYRWDFNDDGIWDTGWSPDPTAGYTWYDDWQGTVKVEVSDGKYTVGAAAAVTVNNVDPVVSIDSITDATTDLPIGPDLPLPVALVGLKVNLTGSFSDPGTADTHTATVDWGDDTDVDFLGNVVNVANASHVYFEPGDYTITLEVTDDDGGVGTATAQIKVVDAADAIEIVVDLLLPYDGDSNVTDAIDKLRGEDGGEADNGALDMMAKGNLNAAMEKILQAEQALETVDLPYIKSLLALAAKSGALQLIGQAEAAASKKNELRKIEEAKALMEQADACLADHDFVGAVDMCQAACRELAGIQ